MRPLRIGSHQRRPRTGPGDGSRRTGLLRRHGPPRVRADRAVPAMRETTMTEEHEGVWGDVHPFFVDDDQLAGLSAAMVFTLGVEWGMFHDRAVAREPEIVGFVHEVNGWRVKAELLRCGYDCEVEGTELRA